MKDKESSGRASESGSGENKAPLRPGQCSMPWPLECVSEGGELGPGLAAPVLCSASDCPRPPFLHFKCFDRWVAGLKKHAKNNPGGKILFHHTDQTEDTLFKNDGVYAMIIRQAKCPCGQGYLRKDFLAHKLTDPPKKKKKAKKDLPSLGSGASLRTGPKQRPRASLHLVPEGAEEQGSPEASRSAAVPAPPAPLGDGWTEVGLRKSAKAVTVQADQIPDATFLGRLRSMESLDEEDSAEAKARAEPPALQLSDEAKLQQSLRAFHRAVGEASDGLESQSALLRSLKRLAASLEPWHEHRNLVFCRGSGRPTLRSPALLLDRVRKALRLLPSEETLDPNCLPSDETLSGLGCDVALVLHDLQAHLDARRRQEAKTKAKTLPLRPSSSGDREDSDQEGSGDEEAESSVSEDEEAEKEAAEEAFTVQLSRAERRREQKRLEEAVAAYRTELETYGQVWATMDEAARPYSSFVSHLLGGLVQLKSCVSAGLAAAAAPSGTVWSPPEDFSASPRAVLALLEAELAGWELGKLTAGDVAGQTQAFLAETGRRLTRLRELVLERGRRERAEEESRKAEERRKVCEAVESQPVQGQSRAQPTEAKSAVTGAEAETWDPLRFGPPEYSYRHLEAELAAIVDDLKRQRLRFQQH